MGVGEWASRYPSRARPLGESASHSPVASRLPPWHQFGQRRRSNRISFLAGPTELTPHGFGRGTRCVEHLDHPTGLPVAVLSVAFRRWDPLSMSLVTWITHPAHCAR